MRPLSETRFLSEELKGTPLSGGTFIEIHVDSLLNKELRTQQDFEVEKGKVIPGGSIISNVRTIQIHLPGDKTGTLRDMVSFMCGDSEMQTSALVFSMLLKKCFHASRPTVCFSLRHEDKPQN